jgi:hypothetical protein
MALPRNRFRVRHQPKAPELLAEVELRSPTLPLVLDDLT